MSNNFDFWVWFCGIAILVFFIIGLALVIIGGNKSTSTNGEETTTEKIGIVLMAPGLLILIILCFFTWLNKGGSSLSNSMF
jgi:hypothetical protein